MSVRRVRLHAVGRGGRHRRTQVQSPSPAPAAGRELAMGIFRDRRGQIRPVEARCRPPALVTVRPAIKPEPARLTPHSGASPVA
jgi:hypothetical protein